MVTLINGLHRCDSCLLQYNDHATAQQCEAWCLANNSCNLEITKHAVK